MIYGPPVLNELDLDVIGRIGELRRALRFNLARPRRWLGTLRRVTFARAVQGSNSIEGHHSSVEDAAAIIDDEPAPAASDETRAAISGYRDALTYVLQLTGVKLDLSLLRSLHFMILKHDLTKHPGRWRPREIWVSDSYGNSVYQAPPRDGLEALIDEMIDQAAESAGPPMVTAAMAHLNLTLIHPFSDGNGRMARCVQTLVLTNEGELSPVFNSIEEYLGRNTADYYRVLADVGAGEWSPERSARPWIEFCLTAHLRQAELLRLRIDEMVALWEYCDQEARRHRLPGRCVGALSDAARGWKLTRSLYRKVVRSTVGEDVSDSMATRDLLALARSGLLHAEGQKRGRYYIGSEALRSEWYAIRRSRTRRTVADPYDRW